MHVHSSSSPSARSVHRCALEADEGDHAVGPKVAVTKLVNSLKGVSSRRLRQEFPDLVRRYWRANKLWSGSYFAGAVGGAPLSVVRQYIEQQNRPV
ncbi:IS200/IS605 family transposase [Streptomyces sp. NBC_00647]|uniref:IS200/IS605 family transposase n=1 Tax=Streptomyces sp. NBC_00647 TaxID=2975796 RepID=UPI00386BF32C